jgi:uncharacterized protein (DUF302 family)
MYTRTLKLATASVLSLGLSFSPAIAQDQNGASADGVIRVKSAYALDETIARLKKDIADKGIRFFLEVDQSRLAADAGISVRPSTQLIFGNAPLGTQFVAVKPQAGLDWPVRLLVQQDEQGNVWAVYTDFIWIARRHGIEEGDQAPFKTAAGVIASITSSILPR